MNPMTRRDFFTHSGAGFASVALGALLAEELRADTSAISIDPLSPLAARLPQIAPKARQVIFLFQYGRPLHNGSPRLQAGIDSAQWSAGSRFIQAAQRRRGGRIQSLPR